MFLYYCKYMNNLPPPDEQIMNFFDDCLPISGTYTNSIVGNGFIHSAN